MPHHFPCCLLACNHCQILELCRGKQLLLSGPTCSTVVFHSQRKNNSMFTQKKLALWGLMLLMESPLMLKFSTNVLPARNRQVPEATLCCRGGHGGNINVLQTRSWGCAFPSLLVPSQISAYTSTQKPQVGLKQTGTISSLFFSFHSSSTDVLGVTIRYGGCSIQLVRYHLWHPS